MAYNYSRHWLYANKATADKLIEAADQNLVLAVVFETPAEAQSYRHKINNILASLAVHEPTRAYVRNRVRTKLEWAEDGRMRVSIGCFVDNRGRRPKAIEIPETVRTAKDRVIDASPDEWPTFLLQLHTACANAQVRTIRIKRPKEGVEELAKFLDTKLSPAFSVYSTGPTHITLDRETDTDADLLPLYLKETKK